MGSGTVSLAGCWLLLCQPAIMAPPDVSVARGDLAAVRVTWVGDDFKYQASPGLNTFREYDPDPKACALRCMSQTAGDYAITCIACQGGKLSEFVTIRVKVGTAPQPPPSPPPIEPDAPAAGKLFVLVIEDAGLRTPQTAKVLTDKSLWDEVVRQGHTWRIIPSGSAICVANGYCQLAGTVGTPALLLLTPEGKAMNARKLPTDAAGVLNAIKEYSR